MNDKKEIKTVGLGFADALTLLFIALKLTGCITWSWIWVLSPIWISLPLTNHTATTLKNLICLLYARGEQICREVVSCNKGAVPGDGFSGILMRRIGIWASTYNCAIVLIGHLSKKERSKELYRGLGSIDVVASARSVLQVERDEQDDDIRYVRQIKNSLAPKGDDLSFEIRSGTGFRWRQVSESHREQAKPMEEPTTEPLPKNKHELAALLLKRALANGPVESTDIRKIMADYRIGEKTLNDVKLELGIKPYRKMRIWYWSLPTSKGNEVSTDGRSDN